MARIGKKSCRIAITTVIVCSIYSVWLFENRATINFTAVDELLDQAVVNQEIAGAVSLISHKGKIVHSGVYGMRSIEDHDPMAQDTIFRVASFSKLVTSTAILMLMDRGFLELDDPIANYIPEFQNMQVLEHFSDGTYGFVPARSLITIRQLLNHTSGITFEFWDHPIIADLYRKKEISIGLVQTSESMESMVKRLASLPLLFHPGERWEYGHSTDVLGHIVEVVSGKNLNQYFRDEIFDPLEMKDTYFFIPENKKDRMAVVYQPEGGGLKKHPEGIISSDHLNYSVDYPYRGPREFYSGGGGLCSTVPDFMKILMLLYNGGVLDGVRLLKEATVALMTTNSIGELEVKWPWVGDEFGLGVGVRSADDISTVYSEAPGTFMWIGIFNSHFWVDSKNNLIGVIMTQLFPHQDYKLMKQYRSAVYRNFHNSSNM